MSNIPKKQYDKIADCYARFEEYNPRKHILVGKLFGEKTGILKGKSMLDLGCGLGFFAQLAKKRKAQYVLGVDVSKRMIVLAAARAKEAGLAIDYKVGDITDLRIPRKFDIVTAGFVFNYAPTRTALRKYILAASRHVKHGGKLFAILCNPNNPIRDTKILYRVALATKGKLGDGARLRCEFYNSKGEFLCYDYKFLWSRQTIESLLKKLGFHRIEWIEIKNVSKKYRIPSLPSTNIILYAMKVDMPSKLFKI